MPAYPWLLTRTADVSTLPAKLAQEASFVARTIDVEKAHVRETLRAAAEHPGSAFVEIYQNCNVFNDGAFEGITSKVNRTDMLIPLVHGQPIRFGADGERGVVVDAQGRASISEGPAGRARGSGAPGQEGEHQRAGGRGLTWAPATATRCTCTGTHRRTGWRRR